MNPEFWHKKWADREIGFHLSEANPSLVKHFGELKLPKNAHVFVPLCGKTLDIAWLLSMGCRVSGIELSEIAIKELFEELNISPNRSTNGSLTLYQTGNLSIYQGDLFALTKAQLESVDAIYDRAALVALPQDMRSRYTQHLVSITDAAAQLLISFEYDQSLMSGPPFSVTQHEIQQHYNSLYDVILLESSSIPGGLKGICEADEKVWHLLPITV